MTASSSIMMRLGGYKFSIETAAYTELIRTTTYRWAKQERIGREPARQFVGPGDDLVELNGTIYPHFKGGLNQIEDMKAEAAKGEPLILVDGRGKVWGKYVIEEVREEQPVHFRGGAPKKQLFALRIAKYGEDAK